MAYKSSQIDNLIALRLLKILTTPFNEFPAYTAGIIDEKGKYIVPKNKRTSKQKRHLTYLDRLMINIKKIINKLPGGESKLKNIIAAMFLVKECQDNNDDGEMLTEQYVCDFVERCQIENVEYDRIVKMWEMYVKLKEQTPLMSTGSSCSVTNNTSQIATYSTPLFQQVVKRNEEEDDEH